VPFVSWWFISSVTRDGPALVHNKRMPRLLSQILLATLMFPLGFMVYMAVYIALNQYFRYDYEHRANVLAGFVTWSFVGVYWYRIWRPSVPWNARRVRGTFIAVAVALVAAIMLGAMGWVANEEVGSAIGSITAPLAWLAAAVVAWRETDEEASGRVGLRNAIVETHSFEQEILGTGELAVLAKVFEHANYPPDLRLLVRVRRRIVGVALLGDDLADGIVVAEEAASQHLVDHHHRSGT